MAKMNTHNLALDLEGYGEEPDMKTGDAKEKTAAVKTGHRTVSIIKAFVVAAAALGLLCYMIYGRVELSSLYTQQSELESQLTRLRSENVALESELAQKNGLTQAESYAEDQLGLKKLEKYQIEYVEIPKPSTAEAAAPQEDNIFVSIKNWFMSVLEYIGAQ
ncbi:MAG: septum formation inhibitor [Ruminococcus sp.]|nr:septum formation inhibitor [Ruminococcus sp.]